MSAGTVLLNADLLGEIFRREGHVLKDFEDSPVHTNKSTVAKGTWERAMNGERIRRNSWLEIARYLRIDPPDLLLEETGATFERIVASRPSQGDQSATGIVVKRGALTIVIGDDFSGYTFEKQQRVWQKVYDLLGEVGRGPETTGSVLVNLIVDDEQIRQAAVHFLNGDFGSINATDMLFEAIHGHETPPVGPYSTSHFTNLRTLTARILRGRHLSESDLDEIAVDTMESVFLRLLRSEKPLGSLLRLCGRLIRRNANELLRLRSRGGRMTFLSVGELDEIVDVAAQPPIQPVLRDELWGRVAAFLMRPHPPIPIAALRMRLEGATNHEIAQSLNLTEGTVRRRFREVWSLLRSELSDYLEE